jgi:hypothetical protein
MTKWSRSWRRSARRINDKARLWVNLDPGEIAMASPSGLNEWTDVKRVLRRLPERGDMPNPQALDQKL